jgi:hypothetical protein
MDRRGLVFNRRSRFCSFYLLESFENLIRFARFARSGGAGVP